MVGAVMEGFVPFMSVVLFLLNAAIFQRVITMETKLDKTVDRIGETREELVKIKTAHDSIFNGTHPKVK